MFINYSENGNIAEVFAQQQHEGQNSIDIESDEYKSYLTKQENEIKKQKLQSQMEELDIKRIRAGFEPSIKDESTGETYLDYYTKQIQALREQLESF